MLLLIVQFSKGSVSLPEASCAPGENQQHFPAEYRQQTC